MTNIKNKSKREFLLSIALEYNCVHLLRRCAIAWADGSHLSKQPLDGLSLSTLTEWIWSRAVSIKDSCNDMCIPLFDHSGRSIEPRSQKALLNFSRQLKRLFQLMDMIVTTCHQYIPGQVLTTLQSQRNSICMTTEYQEVLQWLLNMGLLPEVDSNRSQTTLAEYLDSSGDEFPAIPYPYKTLRDYYVLQRRKFSAINPNLIVPKTKNCRILYIDAFIENECNSAILRSEWKKGMGDGLYPPASLQAMLRTLLVPGVNIERKYMLFVYLFMDLSMALRDERYSNVIKNLIKFPVVFKMDPGLIKITQAFWNLDHGEYEAAIDEIISPLAQDQNMSIWQRELLIEALILNDVPHLALRALNAPGSPISPSLEIKTLLANNLVADAFQVQRLKHDRQLLFEFYRGCHEQQKWHFLLNLSLNESEEECLGQYLRSIESSLGENIHFLYLLRRSKYLEAITFIDNLQQKKRTRQLDLQTPNTLLSTYRITMTPSTKQISDLYYSLKDTVDVKLNQKANYPKPLSSCLSQREFDLLGGVYHQSLMHTEQTDGTYWKNQQKKMYALAPSNVPFLRSVRDNSSMHNSFEQKVCYPQPFEGKHKRRLSDSVEEICEAPVSKRYRVDYAKSNINATLLTSFKEKPNTSIQPLRQCETSIENENEDDSVDDLMETILDTPIVKNHNDEVKKSYLLADRINTPLSILKGSMQAKSISSVTSRRSIDSESERSIRFNLPKDNDKFIVTSTPTVPDVFKFGITQRPSIHSTSDTPSKSTSYNHEKNHTAEINSSHQIDATSSPSRKRLRSITPDQCNVVNCIDVAIEKPSKQIPRQLSVSSESSNDQQSDTKMEISSVLGEARESVKPLNWTSGVEKPLDVVDIQKSYPDEVSSSFVHFVPMKRSPITNPLMKNQPIERIVPDEVEDESVAEVQPLPTLCDTTVHSQMSESNKTLVQPIERIIPIEIEEKLDTGIPLTPLLTKTSIDSQVSWVERNKNPVYTDISPEKCSTNSPICITPFPFRKSLFADTSEVFELSRTRNEISECESPLFQRKNLFSDSSAFSETEPTSSGMSNATGLVESTKADEKQCDIVTVQIEDSEDNSIATPEIVETKLSESDHPRQITVESVTGKNDTTLNSSTPFVSRKVQESFQSEGNTFSISNVTISPSIQPRNILSETELNETTHYRYSTFTEDSIFKRKDLFTDSYSDVSDKGNHGHLPSLTRSTRKDYTTQVTNATTQKISAENTFDLNPSGNKDDDGSPIIIDVTEKSHSVGIVSNSTSPDFNADDSYDIYEVSSEIDLALRDEEFDVDDFDESDYEDEDEVIDISSGSDVAKEDVNKPIKRRQGRVSQSRNESVFVASTTVDVHVDEKTNVVDHVVESASENKVPVLLDISKCSEVSFLTASEGSTSGLHLNEQSYQVVESCGEDKIDGSINELMDLAVNEINTAVSEHVKDDIASAQAEEKKSDVAEGDLIGDLNAVRDTVEDAGLTIETEDKQLGCVSSEMNKAILYPDDAVIITDSISQMTHTTAAFVETLPETTVDSQMSESNKTLAKPIERIIPIEIEERLDTGIPSTSLLTETSIDSQVSLMESNKNPVSTDISPEKCSTNSPICTTPFPFRRSLLADTTKVFQLSPTHNERTECERKNLFSDSSPFSETEPTSSGMSNLIATPEIVETKLSVDNSHQITVESVTDKHETTLHSSTLFPSNKVQVLSDSNLLSSVSSKLNNAIVHSDDILMEYSQQSTNVVISEPATNQLSTHDTDHDQLIIDQSGHTLTCESLFESHTDLNKAILHHDDVAQGGASLKQTEQLGENAGEKFSGELISTGCDLNNVDRDTVVDAGVTIEIEDKQLGSVSSELNKAILYPDDAVIIADSISQMTHTTATFVETLSESKTVECDLNKAVLLNDTQAVTLDPTQTVAASIAPLIEPSEKILTDANNAMNIENVKEELVSANTMMDVTEDNESRLVSSNDLNNAVVYEADSIVADSVMDEIKPTSASVIEVDSQKTEEAGRELILDMDEILESAVHPDGKIIMDSAGNDGSNANQNEMENEVPLKKRLRSNSMDTRTEPSPKTISRRRSSSYTTQRSSPVQRSTRRKSVSSELDNAATMAVTALEPNDSLKFNKKDESSTSTEPNPSKIEKTAVKASRSKLSVPVATDSTQITDDKSNDIPEPYALRARTKRTTEDSDDNVSIASQSSTKTTRSKASTRSTRSTRGQSTIDDNSSTTSKRSRNKPKELPVIAEDLSNEVEDESQSYSDTRRLTRAQKAVMSKAAGFHKMVAPLSGTTKRKRKISGREIDESEDDRESVSSTKTSTSNKSKRSRDTLTPVRQSKRLQEKESHADKKSTINDESDKESIASTSTTNSTRRRKGATVLKK